MVAAEVPGVEAVGDRAANLCGGRTVNDRQYARQRARATGVDAQDAGMRVGLRTSAPCTIPASAMSAV